MDPNRKPLRIPGHILAGAAIALAVAAVGGVIMESKGGAGATGTAANGPTNASTDQLPAPPAVTVARLAADHTPIGPAMVVEHGVVFEDEPHVRDLLARGVRCRFWTGVYSEETADLFDLMRLRVAGDSGLRLEYELRHEQRDRYDYVIVRERAKNRDGSDLQGAPGFIIYRYLYDDARDAFELVSAAPEDPGYDPQLFAQNLDPLGFLAQHWDAVCWRRRSFPEVREALAKSRSQTVNAERPTTLSPPGVPPGNVRGLAPAPPAETKVPPSPPAIVPFSPLPLEPQ